MHRFTCALAGALCVWAGAAMAGPRMENPLPAEALPWVEVHHKPGHKGGPPWMRNNQSRDSWRASREVRRTYTQRRSSCRTTYRNYYDAYTGDYVRRSTRVCD